MIRYYLVWMLVVYTLVYVLACHVFGLGYFRRLLNASQHPNVTLDYIERVVASEIRDEEFSICFFGRKQNKVGKFEYSESFTFLPSSDERGIDGVDRFDNVKRRQLGNKNYKYGCSIKNSQDFKVVNTRNTGWLHNYGSLMLGDGQFSYLVNNNVIFLNLSERKKDGKVSKFTVYLGEELAPNIMSFFPFSVHGERVEDSDISLKAYGLAILYDYVNMPRYVYNIVSFFVIGRQSR